MESEAEKNAAPCPNCGRTVSLGAQVEEGQRGTCLQCGAYLEIVGLEPAEIDWAAGEFEDDGAFSICVWNRPLGRKASRQHWRWAAST